MKNKATGQTFLEYALLLGVVVAILSAMTPLIKRSTQAMYRLVSDQLGNQVEAEQIADESGHLEEQYVTASFDRVKRRQDFLGDVTYSYDGTYVETLTTTSANVGYHEDPSR